MCERFVFELFLAYISFAITYFCPNYFSKQVLTTICADVPQTLDENCVVLSIIEEFARMFLKL